MPKIVLNIIIFAIMMTSQAFAVKAYQDFEGVWDWNKEQSKFADDPNDPWPTTWRFKIEKADGAVYIGEDTEITNDHKSVTKSNSKNDGKYYPVIGSEFNGKSKVTQTGDGILIYDYITDNGHGLQKCILSNDKMKMSCDGHEVENGKDFDFTLVFDRIP